MTIATTTTHQSQVNGLSNSNICNTENIVEKNNTNVFEKNFFGEKVESYK